jgi:hypothetical protein
MHKNNGSKNHEHNHTVFGDDDNTEIQKTNQFKRIEKHDLALLYHNENYPLSA